MKKLSVACFAFAALAVSAALAVAEDLGQVELPRAVMLKGAAIQPGVYTFSLVQEGDNLMIQLKQGGAVVANELAITKPAEKALERARIVYQPLKRDSKDDPVLSRILCSWRGTLYLIYFEK